MIWVCISSNSRGSSALTVAWVPTGMKTGVCTSPWIVFKTPRRALVFVSDLRSSNIEQAAEPASRPGSFQGGRPPSILTTNEHEFTRILWDSSHSLIPEIDYGSFCALFNRIDHGLLKRQLP